jgi:hypothetical protein
VCVCVVVVVCVVGGVTFAAVVNASTRLNTLYNCFLTIIANVSPYTRHLTMVAAVKLTSLFDVSARHQPVVHR